MNIFALITENRDVTKIITKQGGIKMSRNTNKTAVQGAANYLDNMKYEMAGELGLNNYANIDKGDLTARQNGYVGGSMTRKLVQYAEEHMKNQQ